MPYNILGNAIELPTEPFIHDDGQFISLREVMEALGGSVETDYVSSMSIAVIGPWSAVVTVGSLDVPVTGYGETTPVTLSAHPFLDDSEMMVPFDLFHDVYGYDAELSDGHTLTVTNPNAL